jgi:hypothetical protein
VPSAAVRSRPEVPAVRLSPSGALDVVTRDVVCGGVSG